MSVIGPDGTRWPANSLRGIEHQSIREFVQWAADQNYLSGAVLDYGCGKQPYRDIVEAAGGSYEGFDRANLPANVSAEDVGYDFGEYPDVHFGDTYWWDAVLCTQVLQYVPDPGELLKRFRLHTQTVVMTYPTHWPEVEPQDLHRFTKAGMERLLTEAGFKIVLHERRGIAAVSLSGDELALGYGVIARA